MPKLIRLNVSFYKPESKWCPQTAGLYISIYPYRCDVWKTAACQNY